MINLLLGAPGGGKSYEATVYHVLPALTAGRRVITNLPLDLAAFAAIDASFPGLVELRHQSKRDKARPFSAIEDYNDAWRHPDSGIGALYVIDECHLALPKGRTDVAVEEWYSLHRHQNADVLLITQSYGKISQAIRDLCQVVYRVRKNVALGSTSSYTRTVQDGLRGEVVNRSVRRYDKRHFRLYRSHTQGTAAKELMAADIKPVWKNWTFLGAVGCLVVVGWLFASGKAKNPMAVNVKAPQAAAARPTAPQQTAQATGIPAAAEQTPQAPDIGPEPLAGHGVHLAGSISMRGRTRYMLALSHNGQAYRTVEAAELVSAGYRFEATGPCFALLRWGQTVRPVVCDAPTVSPPLPSVKEAAKTVAPGRGETPPS